MQKHVSSLCIVGFLFFLGGCQSTNPDHPMGFFNTPFNPPAFAQQGNLTQSVQEALMRHDELAVAPIRVETRQNVVILSGYVKKIRQSDAAEQIARQVPGVQSVENHIIVRP